MSRSAMPTASLRDAGRLCCFAGETDGLLVFRNVIRSVQFKSGPSSSRLGGSVCIFKPRISAVYVYLTISLY